ILGISSAIAWIPGRTSSSAGSMPSRSAVAWFSLVGCMTASALRSRVECLGEPLTCRANVVRHRSARRLRVLRGDGVHDRGVLLNPGLEPAGELCKERARNVFHESFERPAQPHRAGETVEHVVELVVQAFEAFLVLAGRGGEKIV